MLEILHLFIFFFFFSPILGCRSHSSLKRSETRRSLTRHCCHIQWLESWTPTLPSILIYTYIYPWSLSLSVYIIIYIYILYCCVCIVYQIQAFTAGIIWRNAFVFQLLFRLYICVRFSLLLLPPSFLFFYFTLPTTHIWLRIYTRARMRLALYPLVLPAYFFYDDECRHIFFLDGWMEEMPPPSFFDFLSWVLTRSIPAHRLTKTDGIKKINSRNSNISFLHADSSCPLVFSFYK